MYVDLHCYPARSLYEKSAGEIKNDVSQQGEIQQEFARYSKAGLKLIFASLSPREKGFFTGVEGGAVGREAMLDLYRLLSSREEKLLKDWLHAHARNKSLLKNSNMLQDALPAHFSISQIRHLQNGHYDYFNELKNQYKFYCAQASHEYALLQSGDDVRALIQSQYQKPAIAFTVNGIHSLGAGNPEDEFLHEGQIPKDVSLGKLKSRIRQLKGEEPLEDSELKTWDYPPFLFRLASHFGNGIFGHARSIPETLQGVLDQRRHLDKGVIKPAGYEIVRELLGLDEHLRPTGSRRILIDLLHLSASARNDLYEKIYRTFNKNIDPKHPIPVVFAGAAYSGIDFLAEMVKNAKDRTEVGRHSIGSFYGGSINLSDEDVLAVLGSNGLIALTLDEWRLGREGSAFEKIFTQSPRAQAIRILTRQLSGIVSVPFAYQVAAPLNIWDCLSIGSNLGGLGRPLERYRNITQLPSMAEDLEQALSKMKRAEPLWFGRYRPSDLVDKILFENGIDFVGRNF